MVNAATSSALEVTPRQALETLESGLGLGEEDLAQALTTNRRTLHRWKTGAVYPQHSARRRLVGLLRLDRRLRQVFTTDRASHEWLTSPSLYLGGMTPAEAIRVGRGDRVEAALEALASGVFV
jgi:hypothetical protein